MRTKDFPPVAFLGIGLMGRPMAQRILKAGYPLTIWNRTPGKVEQLALQGATVATDPTSAVRGAAFVITMLQDGSAVREVATSMLPALSNETVFIDMSSTAQADALALQDMLTGSGARLLDAPVSGGVIGAERAELAIMVGGSIDDYECAESLLCVMGRATYVGPTGCGQLAKLCNQLIVGATLSVVAEALLLAEAGGANPAAVRAAIRGGFAESRILEVHGLRMLERDFLPGGQVKSQTKDMENVLAAAAAVGLNLPVAELVAQEYRSILEYFPQADQSAALLALEKLNPGHRLGTALDRLP